MPELEGRRYNLM